MFPKLFVRFKSLVTGKPQHPDLQNHTSVDELSITPRDPKKLLSNELLERSLVSPYKESIPTTASPISIRLVPAKPPGWSRSFAFLQVDHSQDPGGSSAWKKICSDLTDGLHLIETSSTHSATVAYIQFFKTYDYQGAKVFLIYNAEPGDFDLSSDDENRLNEIVTYLIDLGGYILIDRPNPLHDGQRTCI